MANTTNFGWETPDDTDLVKDGAAAIRTLGSAIDTSLVDLKGGTTGQVLSKASNTDMDFTWVAQDDSNAIQNALLTTTGDTIYASSASTPARLGIGSSGQVLTVSGGVPAWTTISSGGLTLLSTTTLSGATTTISSISQDYIALYLVIYGVTNATSNGRFEMRCNGATNSHTAFRSNAATTVSQLDNVAWYLVSDNMGSLNKDSSANVFTVRIENYASTTNQKNILGTTLYSDENGTNRGQIFSGGYHSNDAVTSLVFANMGGNLSSGTVKLYGVK